MSFAVIDNQAEPPASEKGAAPRHLGYFTHPEHDRLRAEVAAFAESAVRPLIPEMEASRRVHESLSRQIARNGWIGVTIGKMYGGMGLGHVAKNIIIEELARVSGAMGAMVQASQLGVAKIIHFGSEEQKRKWLPLIASGECLPTIAVTEPGCGSHVLGMQSHARRDGAEYVLNGRKSFVGNSHVGDVHGIVVRTGQGSRGLTAFLLEADRPGFSLGIQQTSMGLHGFSYGELICEDCRIPVENRLGEEGDGVAVAYSSSVLYGRLNLGAVALGVHQAIFDETVKFAQTHTRYGEAIAALHLIKHKLGMIHSKLITARTTLYHAAHLLDHGRPCDMELMNAKLVNVEFALDSGRIAMEIFAAHGLYTNRPIERFLRDAFHIFAPAGTSDVQLQRLAESALGQSKGQWSEKIRCNFSEAFSKAN